MFDNIKEIQEKKIKEAVEEALSDASISDLEVEVDGTVVTIHGTVESKSDKKDVLALASEVDGISKIITGITIDGEDDEDEEDEEEDEDDEDGEDDDENTYEVQPGDSMWAIAEAHLGDGNRWMEIYKLNKELIGKKPELIHPGYVLKLPTE